jgi:hypothetical protein
VVGKRISWLRLTRPRALALRELLIEATLGDNVKEEDLEEIDVALQDLNEIISDNNW